MIAQAGRTFLMTDIEGSTRLWEADPETASKAIARHDEIVTGAVGDNNGVIPKGKGEGDSFLAAFDDAADAVAAAVSIQQNLEREPVTALTKVRIAIHHGPVQARGGDFFGPTLNRTARIRSVAHGGQILLSEIAAELSRPRLPEGVTLSSVGVHRLRDLSAPEHIFQATHPALTKTFPPLASLGSPSALPSPPTRFLGRQAELKSLEELITGSRVVSIAGPGGAGKTRLAIECGNRVVNQFADGVWFVDLSTVTGGEEVAGGVAAVFALSQVPGVTIEEQLRERVRGRPLLIILDNCEQVVDEVAEIVHRIVKESSAPKFLATTREHLDVPGEAVFLLEGLPLPPSEQMDAPDLMSFESINLFRERARSKNPSFEVDSENAAAVASIVRRLDGIPLAIELAASRTSILSPIEIDRRLGDRLDLLATTARTVPPRQRSIRGAIDWSFELLDDFDRRAFAVLSVFAGSFAFDAAEAVIAETYAVERLSSLAAKSLIAPAEGRFRMLESIRAYAAEKLGEDDEMVSAVARHTAWFRDLAEANASNLRTREQSGALEAFDVDHENLRVALARSIASRNADDALRIASSLWRYWYIRGTPAEGRRWLEEAVALPGGDDAARAKAMNGLGGLAQLQGDVETAQSYFEAARKAFEKLGDEAHAAVALNNLGNLSFNRGDLETAEKYLHQSLRILRREDRVQQLSTSLNNLGTIAQLRAKPEDAARYFDEALRIAEEGGDRREVARSLILSGRSKEPPSDRADFDRALSIARELRDLPVMANALLHLATSASREGDPEAAKQRFAEALRISGELGDVVGIAYAKLALAQVVGEEDRAAGLVYAEDAVDAAKRARRDDYLRNAEEIVRQLSDEPPQSS